jgi:hypothetical protein
MIATIYPLFGIMRYQRQRFVLARSMTSSVRQLMTAFTTKSVKPFNDLRLAIPLCIRCNMRSMFHSAIK